MVSARPAPVPGQPSLRRALPRLNVVRRAGAAGAPHWPSPRPRR